MAGIEVLDLTVRRTSFETQPKWASSTCTNFRFLSSTSLRRTEKKAALKKRLWCSLYIRVWRSPMNASHEKSRMSVDGRESSENFQFSLNDSLTIPEANSWHNFAPLHTGTRESWKGCKPPCETRAVEIQNCVRTGQWWGSSRALLILEALNELGRIEATVFFNSIFPTLRLPRSGLLEYW